MRSAAGRAGLRPRAPRWRPARRAAGRSARGRRPRTRPGAAQLAAAGRRASWWRPRSLGARTRRRRPPPAAPGELVISFLDIGQGDATLIQHGGASVLVDTGPPDGPILHRLREAGVERLDALVLTHAEADHEGVAPAVLAAFRPRLVLDGGAGWPTRSSAGCRRAAARPRRAPGSRLTLGGIRLSVLWPPPRAARLAPGRQSERPRDRRAARAPGIFDVLLTADAESRRHRPARPARSTCSRSPTTAAPTPACPALLARTAPEVAAIEVGRDNPYGHPTPATLAALRAACPTSCGPTATAPSACTSSAPPPGWSAIGEPGADRDLAGRDSAAVPAFKPAYLIHGDDHGRIAERRARCARWPRARAAPAGSRCSRAMRHAGRGGRRAVGDDVRDRPAVRDRRRRRALEGRRRRAVAAAMAGMDRRDATVAFFAPRGGPLQGPRRARARRSRPRAAQIAAESERQAVGAPALARRRGARARPRARPPGRPGARRPGRRAPAAAAARAREARARARPGRAVGVRGGRGVVRDARPSARCGRSPTRSWPATSRPRCARSSSCASRASGSPACSTRWSAGCGTRSRSPRRSRPGSRPPRSPHACGCRRARPSASSPTSAKRDVEALRRALEVMADLELESRGAGRRRARRGHAGGAGGAGGGGR